MCTFWTQKGRPKKLQKAIPGPGRPDQTRAVQRQPKTTKNPKNVSAPNAGKQRTRAPERSLVHKAPFSMALIYRETKREKNSKIKGAVFLEKEQPESIPHCKNLDQKNPFAKRAPNAEKQSTGEQVKTRRGADTLLSFISRYKCPSRAPYTGKQSTGAMCRP
jgi:hypothetical protein